MPAAEFASIRSSFQADPDGRRSRSSRDSGGAPVAFLCSLFALLLPWTLAIAAADTPNGGAPQRIVSLNLCTDSILFELVARSRIASVTHLSLDPELSYFAEQARGLHINHGLAEEILPLHADLILAGSQTAQPTTRLLANLGLPVVSIDPADSFRDFRQNMRRIAAVVQETERAERLLAAMDARLAALSARLPAARPRAVVLHASGFVVGARTLVTDVLEAAGYENLAADLGLSASAFVPLETLLLSAPDLLVFADPQPRYPSLAHEFLKHPAFGDLLGPGRGGGRRQAVAISAKYWTCGGTFVTEAVQELAATHRSAVGTVVRR